MFEVLLDRRSRSGKERMPEMYMTEGEICYRYRINGCYGEKHISILAQLNACTCKEIDTILRKNGLIPKPRKYWKKRKKAI